jgi:hypothetical protein
MTGFAGQSTGRSEIGREFGVFMPGSWGGSWEGSWDWGTGKVGRLSWMAKVGYWLEGCGPEVSGFSASAKVG